ncbi:protein containing DUF29 [Candidatus Omnitrophus magneticus]|uniref:Protein containing DUF29 n=1 Tax=Candidatus Omnitrophus magneticus TaxID=1609969 RepID=A0A0F0CXD1_9BACT|nr:protein containing DUF29 [Candidatus Omnitrophus magneticus]
MSNTIETPVEQAENKNTAKDKSSLYDLDFYQWALYNAELLRQGKLTEADIENIAEEIESMGVSNKKELASRFVVLIMHLLKWQYQPKRRSKSWISTINTQRTEIEIVLENSPSLKYGIEGIIEGAFTKAQKRFEKETGITKDVLPMYCPYIFEQLMDYDFWPE